MEARRRSDTPGGDEEKGADGQEEGERERGRERACCAGYCIGCLCGHVGCVVVCWID